MGKPLEKRKCPIDGEKIKSCIRCRSCSIMSGFGGAGAFSDGKYNITNDFGGSLHEYIGKQKALELMRYVDKINLQYGGEGTKLYSTANTTIRRKCLENGLHLLDAEVRHLGTDINYVVLQRIYDHLRERVDFHFDALVSDVVQDGDGYQITVQGETHSSARSWSYPSAAAAANGWRASAGRWASRPAATGWISACGWSCRRRCSAI